MQRYKKVVESSEITDAVLKQKIMDEMNPLQFYKYMLRHKIVNKYDDLGLHLFTPEEMLFMDYDKDIDRRALYVFQDTDFVAVKQSREEFYESKRDKLADVYMEYLGEDSIFKDVIDKLKHLNRKLGIDILRMYDEADALGE